MTDSILCKQMCVVLVGLLDNLCDCGLECDRRVSSFLEFVFSCFEDSVDVDIIACGRKRKFDDKSDVVVDGTELVDFSDGK